MVLIKPEELAQSHKWRFRGRRAQLFRPSVPLDPSVLQKYCFSPLVFRALHFSHTGIALTTFSLFIVKGIDDLPVPSE